MMADGLKHVDDMTTSECKAESEAAGWEIRLRKTTDQLRVEFPDTFTWSIHDPYFDFTCHIVSSELSCYRSATGWIRILCTGRRHLGPADARLYQARL